MYQLDFVCIDHSDELLLDAQLHKMITSHMVAGDFNFAPAISVLTTSLFRFNLPCTNSAIAINYAMNDTLTQEQKDMLREVPDETPMDVAVLNSIMCDIIQDLLRHDVATWKLTIYRLEQLSNLTYILDGVNKKLGYDLFDPKNTENFRLFITSRKSQVFNFIEEEEKNKNA